MKYVLCIIILCCASLAQCESRSDLMSIDATRLHAKVVEFAKIAGEVKGIIDSLREFFVGIWDGIKGTFQYDQKFIRWCYKAPGRIIKVWEELQKVFEKFMKTLDIFQFYDDIKEMGLKTLVQYMPCYMLYNLFMHFLEWFDMDSLDDVKQRFMMTFFSNAQLLLNDVMDIFKSLGEGDFHGAGEDIGQIIYIFAFH